MSRDWEHEGFIQGALTCAFGKNTSDQEETLPPQAHTCPCSNGMLKQGHRRRGKGAELQKGAACQNVSEIYYTVHMKGDRILSLEHKELKGIKNAKENKTGL